VSVQLRVRIDDKWYDLSRWRNAHPAGKETNQRV
jgi:cytochrome b involved in lipid metabolism